VRILYRDGFVYSPAAADATALVVDGTQVAWIGSLARRDEASFLDMDEVVDLDGAFLAPAFVDAHVHATATGLALTGLNLSGVRSLADALDRLERHARAGRGRPVLGSGWDETDWPEQRPPTRLELDRASYGGVVYLARVDAHSALASSALLAAVPAAAGLPGFRDDGWLGGPAHDAVRVEALGTLSSRQVQDAQRAARARAASLGVGCLHEMAGPAASGADDLVELLALAHAEPGPDVIGYWAELGGVQAARELGAVGAGGDLFCDGSLGSHTAALREPYRDRPDSRGSLRFTVEQIAEHLTACNRAGVQAGFHAIGDAAVHQIVEAVEMLVRAGARLPGAAHRVEHVELVPDPQRLAATGLIASMQPAFDATWGGPTGMYAQRLGAARARGMNQFAALSAAGVPLAFGSDTPVTPVDPWGAVRAAAYPSDPGAAISPRAAFAAHTRGGWRAARADGDGSGLLRPGAPATFAVWQAGELSVDAPDELVSRWSTDPRAAVSGLPDVAPGLELPSCLQTVVRGTPVYRAR
jgi:predicted amidohydrolase YtcJ